MKYVTLFFYKTNVFFRNKDVDNVSGCLILLVSQTINVGINGLIWIVLVKNCIAKWIRYRLD